MGYKIRKIPLSGVQLSTPIWTALFVWSDCSCRWQLNKKREHVMLIVSLGHHNFLVVWYSCVCNAELLSALQCRVVALLCNFRREMLQKFIVVAAAVALLPMQGGNFSAMFSRIVCSLSLRTQLCVFSLSILSGFTPTSGATCSGQWTRRRYSIIGQTLISRSLSWSLLI